MQSATERTAENESMLKAARAERLVADAKHLLMEVEKDADARFVADVKRILRAVEKVVAAGPAGEVRQNTHLIACVKGLLWVAEEEAENCMLYPTNPAHEKARLLVAQRCAAQTRQMLQTAERAAREAYQSLCRLTAGKCKAEREAYKTLRRQTERQLLQTAEQAELGAYQTPDLNPEKPARKQTAGKLKAEREARRMAEFNERSEARLAGRKLT